MFRAIFSHRLLADEKVTERERAQNWEARQPFVQHVAVHAPLEPLNEARAEQGPEPCGAIAPHRKQLKSTMDMDLQSVPTQHRQQVCGGNEAHAGDIRRRMAY